VYPNDPHSSEVKTGSDLIVDGRTARRERNKDAVLDALIQLANEGHHEPPIELIAERQGCRTGRCTATSTTAPI
jgi:hypothetical protein